MPHPHRHIVLASGSPRRKELLEGLGFRLTVLRADVPEVPAPDESPSAYTRRLAHEKASAVAARLDREHPDWVLAADTVVVFDDRILEKPADDEDAVRTLQELSGARHQVVTSFCWRHRDGRDLVDTVVTDVSFRTLPDAWIHAYVRSGEPMDKAGGYGIQGRAAAFVDRIEGSYSCVVGLPVCAVLQRFEELGELETFPFAEASS